MAEIIEKGSKEAVMKFFGALKDKNIDWEAKEKLMKAFRRSFNKHIERTSRYMETARLEASR